MFSQRLNQQILQKNSRLCVGLDPRLEWIPDDITNKARKKYGDTLKAAGAAVLAFNQEVIDLIAPYVAVVKPQIAFYEQYGVPGLDAFQKTINHAKEKGLLVVADAKRGDIDSTAQAYANSLLGKTNVFGAKKSIYDVDCLTVNPFLGEDSLVPFIDTCREYGKGIFILAKTSNPGSKDIQDLKVKGKTITLLIADIVNKYATEQLDEFGYSNIGVVAGATFPKEAKILRKKLAHSIFLVPGFGAQGGETQQLKSFFNQDGLGAIVNASRSITYPNGKLGKDYKKVIEQAVIQNVKEINKII